MYFVASNIPPEGDWYIKCWAFWSLSINLVAVYVPSGAVVSVVFSTIDACETVQELAVYEVLGMLWSKTFVLDSSINKPLDSLVAGSWSNLGVFSPPNTTLPNSSTYDAGPVLVYVILGSNLLTAAKLRSNVGR